MAIARRMMSAPTEPARAVALDRATYEADVGEESEEQLAPVRYRILGYRQPMLSAAEGGGAPNANFVRWRPAAMRALARSFAGTTYVGGHEWGDPGARYGTVVRAVAEQQGDDMVIVYEVDVLDPEAVERMQNGLIDRFSMAATLDGEIRCTVHDAPLWTHEDCWCWPGTTVDGKICEIEAHDGTGLELSAVNVPAVTGTRVLNAAPVHTDGDPLVSWAARLGLTPPARPGRGGGDPAGGFRAPAPPATLTQRSNRVDRNKLIAALGLAADATDEQILAAQSARIAALELEQHNRTVEAALADLSAQHAVADATVATLRQLGASADTMPAFTAALSAVRASAPPRRAPGTPDPAPTRPAPAALQSAQPPAPDGPQATAAMTALTDANLSPDAVAAIVADPAVRQHVAAFAANARLPDKTVERIRTNPALASMLAPRGGITLAAVQEHARGVGVLPRLRELIDKSPKIAVDD